LISYARSDGEEFSQKINDLLVRNGIPVWQDKIGAIGMEGGKDWWQQITQAINKVEFIVLVATTASLASDSVKKEWMYARQKGVCVYPIMSYPYPDFSKLPKWMKNLHFYNFDQEQQKFINDLHAGCSVTKVPFMAGDLPDDFVYRSKIIDNAISHLIDKYGEPVSSTVVLYGAGGFGKTTILKAICHSEKIRDTFYDGILWITIGQNPPDLISIVIDLIEVLAGDRPGFHTLEPAVAKLKELLSDRYFLIVIDDIWHVTHLRIFLEGGSKCARLISTRTADIIPKYAIRVPVDAMNINEALELLCSDLELDGDINEFQLSNLVTKLGKWPLLLKLANGNLFYRINFGHQTLLQAIEYIEKSLRKKGLTYFDIRDATSRDQAVAKTIDASIEYLEKDERERFTELAVFPEDEDIPLTPTLENLWSKTGKLDEIDTEKLCQKLMTLSLLYSYDLKCKTIRLHDVMRNYLLQVYNKNNAGLSCIHALLLDSYTDILPKRQSICDIEGRPILNWADLDPHDKYLWKYLAYHLYEAGRRDELKELLLNESWITAKLNMTDMSSLIRDYDSLAKVYNNRSLSLIQRALNQSAHILNQDKGQLHSQIYGRLLKLENKYSEIHHLLKEIKNIKLTKPWIRTIWSGLVNTPESPLLRTIKGHNHSITAMAITSDGSKLVTAAEDDVQYSVVTLKIWDLTKAEDEPLTSLSYHEGRVTKLAISSDSQNIVSASHEGTMILWDIHERKKILNLPPHERAVNDVIITTDKLVVSASDDYTLKIWDILLGRERPPLTGHLGPVKAVVDLENGTVISSSLDGTFRIWDLRESRQISSFQRPGLYLDWSVSTSGEWIIGHHSAWDIHKLVLHPDRERIVAISSHGIYMINLKEINPLISVYSETVNEIDDVVLTYDGKWIVVLDGFILRVWDTDTKIEIFSMSLDHHERVTDIVSTSYEYKIISCSFDHTIKIWDLNTAAAQSKITVSDSDCEITPLEFTPDGSHVICYKPTYGLGVWNLQTLRFERYLQNQECLALTVKISSDGKRIASVDKNGTFKVWSIDDGKLQFESKDFLDNEHKLEFLSFINNGYRAIVSNNLSINDLKTTFQLLEVTSKKELGTMHVLGSRPWKIVPANDGDTVIIAAGDSIFSWDISGKRLACTPQLLYKDVTNQFQDKILLVLMEDGRYAVSASFRGGKGADFEEALESTSNHIYNALTVYDFKNLELKPRRLFGHDSRIMCLVPIPNTNYVASGGQGRLIRVWDIKEGKQLFVLRGHKGSIIDLAAFPNRRLLASTSSDHSLKIWDLEKKKEIATFTFDKTISSCAVAPDGCTIIAYQGEEKSHILYLEGINM
jgi:WD40 repeat protein